jgi:predicted transcriptional regulator
MSRHKALPKVEVKAEEEASDLDMRAVKAGLAEIERGEFITLPELRQELEERRRNQLKASRSISAPSPRAPTSAG